MPETLRRYSLLALIPPETLDDIFNARREHNTAGYVDYIFTLPVAVHRNLLNEAARRGISLDALLTGALWEWVDNRRAERGEGEE